MRVTFFGLFFLCFLVLAGGFLVRWLIGVMGHRGRTVALGLAAAALPILMIAGLFIARSAPRQNSSVVVHQYGAPDPREYNSPDAVGWVSPEAGDSLILESLSTAPPVELTAPPAGRATFSPSPPASVATAGARITGPPTLESPTSAEPDLDGDYEADLYPSIRAAATATSRELFGALDAVIPNGQRLETVRIVGNVGAGTLSRVVEVARSFSGQARILVEESRPLPEAASNHGAAQVREPGTIMFSIETVGPADANTQETALSVVLTGSAGERRLHPRVRPAPWLEDLDAYRREQLGGREAFVINSGLHPDARVASVEARRLAAARLLPYLKSGLLRSYSDVSPGRRSDAEWISRLERDLRRGGFLLSSFEQQIRKPYGSFHRQYMLIDPSGLAGGQTHTPAAAQMVHDYAQELHSEHQQFLRTMFSAGGLVLVICLMYLVLNAATKGYYTWTLRLFGAAALVAGVVFVVAVA